MMMHESLTPGIKYSLEVQEYVSTSLYRLEGWAGSNYGTEFSEIRLVYENGVADPIQGEYGLERLDVSTYYNLPTFRYSGFRFHFAPVPGTHRVQIQAKYPDTDWLAIGVVELLPDLITLPSHVNPKQAERKSPTLAVVDDFYKDPDAIRELALGLEYFPSGNHKGKRTKSRMILDGTKEAIEEIMGRKIIAWNYGYNGVFQYCTAEDPLVYHCDSQTYAAVVFLTPDAPPESGTSFFRSRKNGLWRAPIKEDEERLGRDGNTLLYEMFEGNFYDKTRWDLVDKIGNRYNRLAIWDAQLVHAASEYFGKEINDARLFHMFFFDCE